MNHARGCDCFCCKPFLINGQSIPPSGIYDGMGHTPSTLSEQTRALFRNLELWAAQTQRKAPILLSACRTADYQKELQRRWDAGDREGLAARPADNSDHVPDALGVCRAFDLGNDRDWLTAAGTFVLKQFPGVIWGGVWLPPDRNHFAVPARVWVHLFSQDAP